MKRQIKGNRGSHKEAKSIQHKKLNDPIGEAFTKFLEDNGAIVIDVTPKIKRYEQEDKKEIRHK